jgi:hypothetical protein
LTLPVLVDCELTLKCDYRLYCSRQGFWMASRPSAML